MNAADPHRHSAAGQKLLADLRALDRQRDRRHADMMARFDQHDAAIAATLAAERARERPAAQPVVSEPVAEPVSAPAAETVPPAAEIDVDDLLLAASPWSPQYAAWRARHVPSQSNGII